MLSSALYSRFEFPCWRCQTHSYVFLYPLLYYAITIWEIWLSLLSEIDVPIGPWWNEIECLESPCPYRSLYPLPAVHLSQPKFWAVVTALCLRTSSRRVEGTMMQRTMMQTQVKDERSHKSFDSTRYSDTLMVNDTIGSPQYQVWFCTWMHRISLYYL